MNKTSVGQEQVNGISVVINTYNASCHLQQVLDTVKGFDEVVVCDMESTDDTLDIAKRNGCNYSSLTCRFTNLIVSSRKDNYLATITLCYIQGIVRLL